jgi:sensor histidine kinase YesM
LTTLGSELELVSAYLDIEQARFEERLRVSVNVPATLQEAVLPPLVVQALVENAIKHGIAPQRSGGHIRLTAEAVTSTDRGGPVLRVRVQDSGGGVSDAQLARGRRAGVGLANVEQRLKHAYGELAALDIRSIPGEGTTAEIRLPLETRPAIHTRVRKAG